MDEFAAPFDREGRLSIRRKKERLPVVIGRELRACREREGISAVDLARAARISGGTLSKIEHGTITASLTIIQSLSRILGVSLSTLMRRAEQHRSAIFVRRDHATSPVNRNLLEMRASYLLGEIKNDSSHFQLNSSIILLEDCGIGFELVQKKGNFLVYVLEGEMIYRHDTKYYALTPGDSLFFDASWLHGPDRVVSGPAIFLQVHSNFVI
ncbi:helix-turn-helix domain-containing protein [Labrys neptuniae]